MSWRQALPWLAVLAFVTLLRLLVCASVPLSTDEAYYWVWSRALAPGYLDHPPMTALWIRAGTWFCGGGPLGVRLLAPLSAALGTLALARAAVDLGGGTPGGQGWRRGLVAAVLLNATLLLGIGSVIMTPDTPLLFFWTLALAALGRVVATGRGAWWVAVGVAIGLALDSKYTALMTGAGLAGWLVATRAGRSWLRTPYPWVAGLLSLLLFAPVLAWNHAHGWASFAKQGGRAGDWQPARAARYLAELLGGQVGLATPLVFGLVALGLVRAVRAGRRGEAGPSLLAWVTLLPAVVFVQHAFGDRVQANWPGLLYPAATVTAATFAARWWRPAAGLGLGLVLLVYAQATTGLVRLPGNLDVTLQRLGGWAALTRDAGAAGPGFVAADEYGLAAELARGLPGRTVLGIEPRWRLFALPHPDLGGQAGVLVRSERRRNEPDSGCWSRLTPAGELIRRARGQVAERYRLYQAWLRPDLPGWCRAEIVRLPGPH